MPAPVVAPINEGMWEAAARGRLAVHRCALCGAHRYPPADGCYRCGSLDWEWAEVPGTGEIYTYIWVPDRTRAGLYNVVVVTLDGTEGEPVRILSNVVDAWNPGDLDVGQRVELSPVEFEPGRSLPCFRLATR
jgi:uncharacterized OB-fold protein